MRYSSVIATLLATCLQQAIADGNDWVNPAFVLQKNGVPNAQARIMNFAKSTASKGPWTVSGDTTILPPNGDKRDYLSWAPYHWPECNWCTGARAHLATGGNRTDPENEGNSASGSPDDTTNDDGDGDSEGDGNDESNGEDDGGGGDENSINPSLPSLPVSLPTARSLPAAHRKMIKRVRNFAHSGQQKAFFAIPGDGIGQDLPVSVSVSTPIVLGPTSSTTDNFADGSTGVQNARKTEKPHAKTTSVPKEQATQKAPSTKTTGGSGSNCTPSPTRSIPPSATWTTCKYVVKDGHANPDVRDLPGVSNVADVAQSILYNAVAAVLSGSQDYTKIAVQFIQVFFLEAKDGMNPRVAYGQLIRGPGAQIGQYLGLIDLRGMVKVVNAIQIMRVASAAAWTSTLDAQMVNWATQYVKWMHNDAVGQKALAAPNNHGTFATNQLAAWNILVQSPSEATTALKSYFSNQFLDQIAASGEQPFEAVRTRPFHYRCFNLEAMITNAKLGDQLGINFWTARSKYGATIKDALDFVLAKGPGNEDITDIFPHVAAVAAAYGDSNGKYESFLKQKDQRYQVAAYYYYDQPGALTKAPTSLKSKSAQDLFEIEQRLEELAESLEPTSTGLPVATPTIPWECPAAFATQTRVELDDGIYVTCDELKHFYGYAEDAVNDA